MQKKVNVLTQKLFYLGFFDKIMRSVEHFRQLQNSKNQFTKHSTTTIHKCYHFLTDAQQLLGWQLLFFSTLRFPATTALG